MLELRMVLNSLTSFPPVALPFYRELACPAVLQDSASYLPSLWLEERKAHPPTPENRGFSRLEGK